MRTITARKLLGKTTEQLWDTLTGRFILKFDDGQTMETTARQTIYSSYAWTFHREFPDTPLLKTHHVGSILTGGKLLSADTHLILLGNAMWDVHAKYLQNPNLGKEEIDFRDELAQKIYQLTNTIYNELSYRTEEYVTTLSLRDFLDVVKHPKVQELYKHVKQFEESTDNKMVEGEFNKGYAMINDMLSNGKDFPTNPISKYVRSRLVSANQVNQCVAFRGYLTDIDSNVFRYPITANYTTGIRSFHDSLIESRSAAKSLTFSKEPLQQAEYFSRRLQLMNQVVRNLHMGDCGTTKYENWKILPNNLKLSVGKYYLDEQSNELKAVKATDTHLIGKTIKMRAVSCCAHPDPFGICSTCFGQLSYSVPRNTNIGQMCCTSVTQKSSQLVLSVKHFDGSSVVDGIELDSIHMHYLRVAADQQSYMLNERLKDSGKKIYIVLPPETAPGLTDIMEAKEIESLNIIRVSELTDLHIRTFDGRLEEDVTPIPVELNRRLASMTYPLLKHIREKGWNVDDKGNYVIDMDGWDYSQTILTLPMRHFNMSDHSKDIANMLESSIDQLRERDTNVTPSAFLVELFELVNSKLDVNLAVLEVVMLGVMIVSAEEDNYSLPKPWTSQAFGVMKRTMSSRCLSSAMAFEGHKDILTDPASFNMRNRFPHLLSAVLMPQILNGKYGHYVG